MPSQNSLQRKINTANDLLSVVRTMKSLASVNLRQYEQAVNALDEYADVVKKGWQAFFLSHGGLPKQSSTGKAVFLVLGTDQGMCGQFNDILVEKCIQKVREVSDQVEELVFWSAGERMEGALYQEKKVPQVTFSLPGSLQGIDAKVAQVIETILSWNSEQSFKQFYLFFNRPLQKGGYRQTVQKLLPLDKEWAWDIRDKKWERRNIPQVPSNLKGFFTELFKQHLYISLFRGFGQSLAAENSARLASMQSAERNIRELKNELQAKYNHVRQETITAELFDVISGFEALAGR